MFNQLTPPDVVTAIGVTVRDAARSGDRSDAFSRDQLMSAYSATRHLAAELSSFEPAFDAFAAAVVDRLRGAATGGGELSTALGDAADRIAADRDPAIVGAAVADVLARLRGEAGTESAAVAAEVRALLRGLADREVDLLADALA